MEGSKSWHINSSTYIEDFGVWYLHYDTHQCNICCILMMHHPCSLKQIHYKNDVFRTYIHATAEAIWHHNNTWAQILSCLHLLLLYPPRQYDYDPSNITALLWRHNLKSLRRRGLKELLHFGILLAFCWRASARRGILSAWHLSDWRRRRRRRKCVARRRCLCICADVNVKQRQHNFRWLCRQITITSPFCQLVSSVWVIFDKFSSLSAFSFCN